VNRTEANVKRKLRNFINKITLPRKWSAFRWLVGFFSGLDFTQSVLLGWGNKMAMKSPTYA